MRFFGPLVLNMAQALYSETISGTNVVRAFGASSLFMATCFQRIDQK